MFVSIVQVSYAKILDGEVQLDGADNPEVYISKFSINNEGSIKGELKTASGEDVRAYACARVDARTDQLSLLPFPPSLLLHLSAATAKL